MRTYNKGEKQKAVGEYFLNWKLELLLESESERKCQIITHNYI
jgi:hypothetical protein